MTFNPASPPHGIVFDLDGTLVDSLSVTIAAFNHGIMAMGGRKHTTREIMSHFGPGEGQIFARIVGPEKAEEAYVLCRAYLQENLSQVPLHAGIGDLLETLKSQSIPIAIFTGRSWNTTEVILRHHGVLDRFITVVANDHVRLPKPAPEGLRLAAQALKLPPSALAFVGDHAVDMQVAHSAGARAVAATWDALADREELALHRPHHWATTPAEVLAKLLPTTD